MCTAQGALCTAHPALCTAHPALRTAHAALGTAHPALCTVHPALSMAHSALGAAQPALGTAHPALGTAQPALCATQPALGTAHPALCTVHSALGTAHSALCTVHPAFCTVDSALGTAHSAPCTRHSAPCTVHPAPSTVHPAPLHPAPGERWQKNVYAVTAASFLGYTGFTLVMPFLPLFIGQLGVTDVGQIAIWTGVSLGVTPGLTAILAPAWGKLGDRYGRKIMVERSMASFVVLMAAMAFVTRAWHVLALRAVQGLFAGYGSLSVAMAAESAPRDRMPSAIGLVQTAQRLGPGVGPVIGGLLAGLVGLRRAFIVTALFYGIGLVVVYVMYDDRATHAYTEDSDGPGDAGRHLTPITFRDVLAFQNFILMMVVIFGLQFVDRSFGPILPLYVEQVGIAHDQVAIVSGVLFSIMAATGALGHHLCGKLLRRYPTRTVISSAAAVAAIASVLFVSSSVWMMGIASAAFGIGIGAAMTASYSAAGRVIPAGAHGTGFGVLTSASLVGMASSPFFAGLLGGTSIRVVFFVNVAIMGGCAAAVRRMMVEHAARVG
jgi:MFS transporter, DHA1 family, multidrug resistance protein